MKNLRKALFLLLIGVILLILYNSISGQTESIKIEGGNKRGTFGIEDENPNNSAFWIENPISIDGAATGVGANNWTWVETQSWLSSGNGSLINPYIIENITISDNNTGSGIEIRNSNKYFIIRNVTLHDTGTGSNSGGIKLYNVTNGRIESSSFALNDNNGILMQESSNNEIEDNDFISGGTYAIRLSYSNNNTIIKNEVREKYWNGLILANSDNNTISENKIILANDEGIEITNSNNNTIFGNNISYSAQNGFRLVSSNYNKVYGNNLSFNSVDGIELMDGHNNTIFNNIAKDNGVIGIDISSSCYKNNISGNTASNNLYYGIELSGINNSVTGNIFINDGFWITGSYFSNYIDQTNLVNGKNLYYYVSKQNLNSNNFTNAGQVFLVNCNDSLISNLNISNSDNGISVLNGKNNTISDNIINNNTKIGVYLYYCINHTVSNNTAKNNDYKGIYCYNSNNITLFLNNISNSDYGIHLDGSDISRIILNNITNNNIYGIFLDESDNNTISINNISNNKDGIYMYTSVNNIIKGNYFINNSLSGIYTNIVSYNITILENIMVNCGLYLGVYYDVNIDQSNTVNGKILYYYISKRDLGSNNFTNAGQVILVNCSASKISNLGLSRASNGITLAFCVNITVFNNSLRFNQRYGIYLKESDNITIKNNDISHSEIGVYLYASDNSTVVFNNVSNNIDGVYLRDWSGENTISFNNISENHNGIRLYSGCESNNLSHNIIRDNSKGIYSLASFNWYNIIAQNTISGNSYGIEFMSYQYYNIITANNVTKNDYGIYLNGCGYSNITNNNVSDNKLYSFFLFGSGNQIYFNQFDYNDDYGVYLTGGSSNLLRRNSVKFNAFGMYLANSQNITLTSNTFYHNPVCDIFLDMCEDSYVYNNSFDTPLISNAFDNGINNQWYMGVVGNYWNNYGGKDTNDDGIGDTPYFVFGSSASQDIFPQWWDSPVISSLSPVPESSFGEEPPNFLISINEGVANTSWYSVFNGKEWSINITFTGLSGTINDTLWESLSEGIITLKFYINDSRGYIDYSEVVVLKSIPEPKEESDTQEPELPIQFILMAIVIASITTALGLNYTQKSRKKLRAKEAEALELIKLKSEMTEEDIILSKERRICLVHKGPVEGKTFICPECGAFYCEKCYEAVRDIENSCWSCKHPLDDSIPIKQVKKEDVDIEGPRRDEVFKPDIKK